MKAVYLFDYRPSTLWLWMHDAPKNVVQFPLFTAGTPLFIVQEAARKYRRVAHFDNDTGFIRLEKR